MVGFWMYSAKHGFRVATETNRLRAKIFEAIRPKIRRATKAFYHAGGKAQVEAAGGISKMADDNANAAVKNLYKTTFGVARQYPAAYAQPYIASFCLHTGDDEYTKNNGLLSMWRGYGTDGGVAVCFSTKKLEEAIELESKAYWYQALFWGEVTYESDEQQFRERFGPFLDQFGDLVVEILTATGKKDLKRFYERFVQAACRYKHRAFREERELRLVASPGTPQFLRKFPRSKWKDVTESRPFKRIYKRYPRGSFVPHTRLFETDEIRLPITRVIVGPHVAQDDRVHEIEKLVRGSDIEVQASETPYIPLTFRCKV